MTATRCQVPRCRNAASLVYLKRDVCDRCWDRYTAEGQPDDALRRKLGIPLDTHRPAPQESTP